MFGFVSLGGQKLEAFIWEIEDEPNWFDCVILYTQKALEQEVVSLRFRVPAERVFMDDKVGQNLSLQSATIASKCQTKIRNSEHFRSISFENMEDEGLSAEEEMCLENQLSEAEMLMEIEQMLRLDTNRSAGGEPVDFLDDGDFMEGAMLYEAETFGGKMIEDSSEAEFGGDFIRKASTIKRPLIEQFLDSPNLSLRDSMRGLRRDLSQRLAPTVAPTLVDEDLMTWSIDLEDKVVNEVCLKLQKKQNKPAKMTRFATTTTLVDAAASLPPMDDEPTLGNRQAAFVSTRGKEREIWQTYREEITQTWRAELEELRRDLFTEPNMGA